MNYASIKSSQKQFFNTRKTFDYDFRVQQIKKLKLSIKEFEEEILDALEKDFGKPRAEGFSTEIGILYSEINHTLKHLRRWMRKKRVSSPITAFPSSSYIQYDPRGMSLIIAPWNYPFMLSISPLISALAAGNTAVIKPSEMTPATAAMVEKVVAHTFPSELVEVILGNGHEVVPKFIDEAIPDHIFFTGSPMVGSIIAQQAAVHLIPITLELGGKSPAIIGKSAHLKVAANRIAWGKWVNAGQTCIAPDYLLVHEEVYSSFLSELSKAFSHFSNGNALENNDHAKIINQKRFEVLSGYLKDGKIFHGGKTDAKNHSIEPTILTDVSLDDSVMKEEIFGPVLPVLKFKSHKEAQQIIENFPNPLSLYVFSKDDDEQQFFTKNIAFGGGSINNTLLHLANNNLPFGGVRTSGIGNYHGKYGFESFSHAKSILKSGTWFDLKVKYPPYTTSTLKLLKWFFN